MKKLYQYTCFIVLPIALSLGIALLYKILTCYFSGSSEDASFVCGFNWKDGLILLCSYAIVKLISPILGFETIAKRLLVTLGLYCFAYAVIALPFLIASFFQPFLVNTFFHAILLILVIELIFSRFGYYTSKSSEVKE